VTLYECLAIAVSMGSLIMRIIEVKQNRDNKNSRPS